MNRRLYKARITRTKVGYLPYLSREASAQTTLLDAMYWLVRRNFTPSNSGITLRLEIFSCEEGVTADLIGEMVQNPGPVPISFEEAQEKSMFIFSNSWREIVSLEKGAEDGKK